MPSGEFESVGDFFFIGLRPATTLQKADRDLLQALKPAGVILYKSNFLADACYEQWLEAHRRLLADVRDTIGRDRLIVAIDHEGGRVCRPPPPVTRFSYPSAWADRAGAVGAAMGRELSSLGINLNFAPLLDINSNPANPVIGARAFGSEARTVTQSALAFMAGMEGEGVLACGKHFPGHGEASADSHYELPVVDLTMADLAARELRPFSAAIQAGLKMLMTAHLLFPQVDPGVPVTLSRRFITDLLRDEMGFEGVCTSDDIGMQAMNGVFDDPSSAARLLDAGCDMLMLCAHWTDTERARGFAASVLEARRTDPALARRLEMSRARIERFIAAAPQNEVVQLPAQTLLAHAQIAPLFAEATVEVT